MNGVAAWERARASLHYLCSGPHLWAAPEGSIIAPLAPPPIRCPFVVLLFR